MATPSPLAQRVRMVREAAGLSKRGLSARAGLNPSHVRLLEESGQRTSALTIESIATALRVRWEWLLKGDEPAFDQAPDVDPTNPRHAARVRELVMDSELGDDPVTTLPPPPTPGPVRTRASRTTKRKPTPKRKAA